MKYRVTIDVDVEDRLFDDRQNSPMLRMVAVAAYFREILRERAHISLVRNVDARARHGEHDGDPKSAS